MMLTRAQRKTVNREVARVARQYGLTVTLEELAKAREVVDQCLLAWPDSSVEHFFAHAVWFSGVVHRACDAGVCTHRNC